MGGIAITITGNPIIDIEVASAILHFAESGALLSACTNDLSA